MDWVHRLTPFHSPFRGLVRISPFRPLGLGLLIQFGDVVSCERARVRIYEIAHNRAAWPCRYKMFNAPRIECTPWRVYGCVYNSICA